eukprot:3448172-Pyramimonas_sp.AAC.1
MAAFCDKLGDRKQAESHRRAAKAFTAPEEVPQPVQIRLNKAHWKVQGVDEKLKAALEKHDALQRQLNEQKTAVLELRSELISAEAEQKSLVQ